MDTNLEKTLSTLHTAVAQELLDRVQSGDAKPADMSNAIKFLKDNNIDAIPVQGSPLDGLLEALPFNSESLQGTLSH